MKLIKDIIYRKKSGFFSSTTSSRSSSQSLASFITTLEDIDISIIGKEEFDKWRIETGIITPKNIRIVTESALIGGLTTQGIPVDLSIMSDGARQFNIFNHALCWVHAERGVNRLIPLDEEDKQLVKDTRKSIWEVYQKLKE